MALSLQYRHNHYARKETSNYMPHLAGDTMGKALFGGQIGKHLLFIVLYFELNIFISLNTRFCAITDRADCIILQKQYN